MLISIVVSGLRRWMRSRETYRELARLSDRELADIGVSRSEITAGQRRAADAHRAS